MRERPILFTREMVRAIIDGRKTQTRRLVRNPGRLRRHGPPGAPVEYMNMWGSWQEWVENAKTMLCPYGVPGDRLWVRETHTLAEAVIGYDADGSPRRAPLYRATSLIADAPGVKWRSSIHMPRWACRLVLEVVDVRPERLCDISETDAQAEGLESRAVFEVGWDRINGKRAPWASNPWVWVVTFRRTESR